jgi:hypothetical protein
MAVYPRRTRVSRTSSGGRPVAGRIADGTGLVGISQVPRSLERNTHPVPRADRGMSRLRRRHDTRLAQDSVARCHRAAPNCPSIAHVRCIRHVRTKLESGANRYFHAKRLDRQSPNARRLATAKRGGRGSVRAGIGTQLGWSLVLPECLRGDRAKHNFTFLNDNDRSQTVTYRDIR